MHDALELIKSAKAEDVYAALVHLLRIAKDDADSTRLMDTGSSSLERTRRFLEELLEDHADGARLAAAWGALLQLSNEGAGVHVKVYHPKQSEELSSTLGDVEVFVDGTLVSAAKCKHRPLNIDDVKRALAKNERRIDYTFVATGVAAGEEETVLKLITEAAALSDVTLLDAANDFPSLLNLLGPHRRNKLGPSIVSLLRQLREFEAADRASALWKKP